VLHTPREVRVHNGEDPYAGSVTTSSEREQAATPTDDGIQDHPPLTLDAEAFERLVVDELDQLPDDMIDGLDNVVFVVEDRPEDGSLDLLGLYDGWALTERDRYGVGELPDRIILYREPHLAACADEDELRDEIHTTLVHEIAHFYGIDDERLHELGWA
jgi:predicted Zn-dependent protease with MMP-like domain